MRKVAIAAAFTLLLVAAAPSAYAEPDPGWQWNRIIVYWTGECDNTTRTYAGHYEFVCGPGPNYSQGTRAGKWRAISDTHCTTEETNDFYQVCTSGDTCDASGTWVTISNEDYVNANCP